MVGNLSYQASVQVVKASSAVLMHRIAIVTLLTLWMNGSQWGDKCYIRPKPPCVQGGEVSIRFPYFRGVSIANIILCFK